MKITLFFLSFILIILNGCGPKKLNNNVISDDKSSSKTLVKDENFASFYDKFYSDSIFQISRIVFPLPCADSEIIYGDAVVADQENESYFIKNNKIFYKKNGWKFLTHPYEKDTAYVKTIEKIGSNMREHLRDKESGSSAITCEFALIEKKWMLVFFGNVTY